ncbi:hypothetical protein [Flavobacterium daemonense]|uniref:hypothetical protein n=1 Tax=Flavobacterium daemonense TaxID=1393049 RepID=UPI001186475E|nr:hypothetical protein [Flavobacterium daemonense]KAF2337204.1 hypothetical protein FND99_01980 [Flavobacterium daemonense]
MEQLNIKSYAMVQDPRMQKLLLKLNAKSEVQAIPVQIESYSQPFSCYRNVGQKLQIDGGKIHYGWHIHLQDFIFEAEHHAVWENEKGELICITPNQHNKSEIIFVSDNEKVFNGTSFGNVRINATDNDLIDDFILISEAIDELESFSVRVDDTTVNIKKPIGQILQFYRQWQSEYYTYYHYGKDSSMLCHCYSGKTYFDCHKKRLKDDIAGHIEIARRYFYE